MNTLPWPSVAKLAPLAAQLVSVTHGAAGSTRDRTLEVVQSLRTATAPSVAPHLTGSGASKTYIRELACSWELGIRRSVALRGDPAPTSSAPPPDCDSYLDGAELVAGLLSVANFDLSVAAYPEVHPDAVSAAADLAHLQRKLTQAPAPLAP